MSLREELKALKVQCCTYECKDGALQCTRCNAFDHLLTRLERDGIDAKNCIRIKLRTDGAVEGHFPPDTPTSTIVEMLRPVTGHIRGAQEKLDAMVPHA